MASASTVLVWPGRYVVARLDPAAELPDWVGGPWISVTRTRDELSIACLAERVPPGVRASRPSRLLEVEGPLDPELTGVMASLAAPLAAAGVSILPIATFDTDYLLVPAERLSAATAALRATGHTVGVRAL